MKNQKKLYIAFISVFFVLFLVFNIFSFIPYKELKNDSYSFAELFPNYSNVIFDGTENETLKNELENSTFHPVKKDVFKKVTDDISVDAIQLSVVCTNKDFQFLFGHIVNYHGDYYLLFTAKTKFRGVHCMFLIESSNKEADNYAGVFTGNGYIYGMYPTVSLPISFGNFLDCVFKYNAKNNLLLLLLVICVTVIYFVISKKDRRNCNST